MTRLSLCPPRLPAALALAALLALPPALAAQAQAQAPEARAARAEGALRIDGRMDEAGWAAAEPIGAFTESYPDAGVPARDPTEARVLLDGEALYVGLRMRDARPDSVAAPLARRDASGIYSDWVHVMVDSYHDRRTSFRFSVNPRGVQRDALGYDDSGEDASWDAIWQAAARVDSLGWTAELRIPLSQLRFREGGGGASWGFQVWRDVARRAERSAWAPWTPRDPGTTSRFGTLLGVEGARGGRRLEVQPYASTRLLREPGTRADPFWSPAAAALSAGADLRVGLTPGITLAATLNPDFGQVEADPAVVNLTAFETFFPERRPFFVEGADVFRFGAVSARVRYGFEEMFHSRRVGRAPQAVPSVEGAAWMDVPVQTSILGAAKVTGKAGPWTVGVLDAVTGSERARWAGEDGTRGSVPVEPLSHAFVGRVRRELRGGRTVVGAMGTSLLRRLEGEAMRDALRSRAWVGGADFAHAWAGRAWTLSGYLAASRIEGSPASILAAQDAAARHFGRPDAAYLERDPARTALSGHLAEIALQRAGRWTLSLDAKQASPGFEAGDLGFQGRADYRSVSAYAGRRSDGRGRTFQSLTLYGAGTGAWNFGGAPVEAVVSAGGSGTLRSFWEIGGEASLRPARLDDRLTRGGPLARVPAGWSVYGSVRSDARRRLRLGLSGFHRGDRSGAGEGSLSFSAIWRPSPSLRLAVGPSATRARTSAQYVRSAADSLAVATFGRRYLFAELDQTTVSLETRLEWTFSPALSLQLYAQPFVSAGAFRRFKELRAPRTADFAVYGHDAGTLSREETPGGAVLVADPDGAGGPAAPIRFADPDFTVRSLRGNAVLRWEYRPGSTLFFVWQQQRSGRDAAADFALSRDAGALFRAPATNVFLVKATYWISR